MLLDSWMLKIQLDDFVDLEKCCKMKVDLQSSVTILANFGYF